MSRMSEEMPFFSSSRRSIRSIKEFNLVLSMPPTSFSDIYAEAKGVGFDVKIMKAIIKLRKMNQADRDEQEFLLETYRKALNV